MFDIYANSSLAFSSALAEIFYLRESNNARGLLTLSARYSSIYIQAVRPAVSLFYGYTSTCRLL